VSEIEAADLDQFVAEIYRVAIERSPADFIEWCFDQIPGFIETTAMSWANLMSDGSIHNSCFRGIDDSTTMFADYESVREFDRLSPQAMKHQDQAWSANALDPANPYHESFQEFALKHNIPRAMAIVSKIPATESFQIIALWRDENATDFGPADKARLEYFASHLMHGLIHSRRFSIRSRLLAKWSEHNHIATITRQGLVIDIEEGFSNLVLRHWPNHNKAELPSPLLELANPALTDITCLRAGTTLFRLHRHEAVELLIATELGELTQLTDRELEISQMFAGGSDHRQIAETIQRSSATVRNHLRSVYQKLNVSTRTELATVLARLTPFKDN